MLASAALADMSIGPLSMTNVLRSEIRRGVVALRVGAVGSVPCVQQEEQRG